MKKIVLILLVFLFFFAFINVHAQPSSINTPMITHGQSSVKVDDPTPAIAQDPAFEDQEQAAEPQPQDLGPRYAACDLCGFCPPNDPPQSWEKCQQCLYPEISSDPSSMESLVIDPETNLPPSSAIGRQYTFFGCLGGGGETSGGFTEEGAAGGVIQSLLNIVFSMSGGIAFLYLLYGSFTIATSQANPERLNYGRRVVYGAIAGLIFTLASVFIVKFIASGILKVPGFGE